MSDAGLRQLTINFDASLREQFPVFMDCVRASVHGCGRAFKSIAADLDMSPSELSRKLADNPNDPVNFPLKELPALIRATRDQRPLHWLLEEFCESAEVKKDRARAEIAALLPKLISLAERAA